jgi:hypothetical protein
MGAIDSTEDQKYLRHSKSNSIFYVILNETRIVFFLFDRIFIGLHSFLKEGLEIGDRNHNAV